MNDWNDIEAVARQVLARPRCWLRLYNLHRRRARPSMDYQANRVLRDIRRIGRR